MRLLSLGMVLFILLLFLGNTTCFGNDYPYLEKLTFFDKMSSVEELRKGISTKITYIEGAFSKVGFANPGDVILRYFDLSLDAKTLFSYSLSKEYIFLGATGDKTFELEFIYISKEESSGIDNKREKIKNETNLKLNMFFEDKELFHFKEFYPIVQHLGANCPEDAKVFLKMFKLKGNQLDYQIIIPDCLKKNAQERGENTKKDALH